MVGTLQTPSGTIPDLWRRDEAIWAITHEREMTAWALRNSSLADALISDEITLSR